MTLATGIEIGAGGSPAPGTGGVGTASQGFLPSIASGVVPGAVTGAKSFRDGWQSLLTSLGSSVEGFSEIEPEANREALPAGSASAIGSKTRSKSSGSTSALASSGGLSLRRGREKGSRETCAGAEFFPAGTRAGASSARTAAGIVMAASSGRVASSRTEERKPAAKAASCSGNGAPPAPSFRMAGLETVATAGVMPDLLQAAIASLPQTVEASAMASPATHGTNANTHSALADLSSADPALCQPGGLASASFLSHSSNPDRLGAVAVAAHASQQMADGEETSARQGQPSLAPSLNEPSGPDFNRRALTNAPGLNRAEMIAEGQSPISASAPSRDSTLVLRENQDGLFALPSKRVEQSEPASIVSEGPSRLTADVSTGAAQPAQPLSAPPFAGEAISGGSGKSPASGASRSARGAGNADAAQHGTHPAEGPLPSPAVDASAMAREGTGVRSAVSLSGELTRASTASAASPEPRETFAALDAGEAAGKPTWIHAGAQRAEAGFQDPALGWVGVRADTSGGGVHAQLVPGSADAAQALGGHLAGLNAYLAEHHTPVETLTLTAPESGWAGPGDGGGEGQNMQQETGQQMAQNADSGSPSGPSTGDSAILPAAATELPAFQRGLDGSAEAMRPGAIHISVVA